MTDRSAPLPTAETGARKALLLCALVAGGCGISQAKRDETSAAQHRAEGARDAEQAQRELQLYNPRAEMTRQYAGPVPPGAEAIVPERTYNPTQKHLMRAENEADNAREHLDEAADLDAAVAAECASIPRAARAACPRLGPVARVTEIDRGVRLDYAEPVDLGPQLARLRCHLAYARNHAFHGNRDCPFYLRGVDIRAADDGRGVEIIAEEEQTRDELRRLGRQLASRPSAPIL